MPAVCEFVISPAGSETSFRSENGDGFWRESSLDRSVVNRQVSSDQNPGWLGCIGDYTTQLYRDL